MKIVFVAAALLAFASAHSFEDDPEFNEFFDSLPSEPAGRVGRAQASYYPPTDQKTYAAQPYGFAYDVSDGYNNYGHKQESDGSVTTGSYRVLLPDGRTQIVNYKADKNGYVASVQYEEPASPTYKAPVTKTSVPVYRKPSTIDQVQVPTTTVAPPTLVYKVPLATQPAPVSSAAAPATSAYRPTTVPTVFNKLPIPLVFRVPAATQRIATRL